MKRPVCRVCGQPVVNGNLYCSKACGEGRTSHRATAAALEARGFVRDPETPNVFLKDGVGMTVEHVAHVGLEQALKQHGHAAEARKTHL